MCNFRFDQRARLSVELALTAGNRTPLQEERQDAAARSLGMSGAEIDVARQGRSFDVLTGTAMRLAIADAAGRAAARAKALKAGISEAVCSEIEGFAAELISASSTHEATHV